MKNQNGFTLIELLVVIAVLGVLAGLVMPRLTGVIQRARIAEAEEAVGSLKTSMEMLFVENNSYILSANLPIDNTSAQTANSIGVFTDFSSLPDNWSFNFSDAFGSGNNPTANNYAITAIGNGINVNLGVRINQAGILETTTDGVNWN